MDSKAIFGKFLQEKKEAFKKIIWVPEHWIQDKKWVDVIKDFIGQDQDIVDELYLVFMGYYSKQLLEEVEKLNPKIENLESDANPFNPPSQEALEEPNIYLKAIQEEENAEAARLLSRFYIEGDVLRKDVLKAAFYLRYAATKGNVSAMCQLHSLLNEYNIKPLNNESMDHWKEEACKRGAYWEELLEEEEVEVSGELALKEDLKASKRGEAKAQFNFGSKYKEGRGIAQSDKKAIFDKGEDALADCTHREQYLLSYLQDPSAQKKKKTYYRYL